MTTYIDWPGQRGTYRYWFLTNPTDPSAVKKEAGNYAFVKPGQNGWIPVRFGIATDLSDRIPGHEDWPAAQRLGATRIMAHTNSDKAKREAEEKDLIGHWNPPLNIQHRTRRAAQILRGS